MILRCAIVDDERLAREALAILLSRCTDFQVEIVDHCASVEEVVDLIGAQQVDVVFLDINMPECDGFELFGRVNQADMPFVVFVTAYAEYAVQGFDANAVDYLLKPVDKSRLAESLGRVSNRIVQRNAAETANAYLFVMDGGQGVRINVCDIICIQAAGDYMCICTVKGDFVRRSTLKRLLTELSADRFVRIHRSTAVNLDHIREIVSLGYCRYRLEMTDGTILQSSKRYRDAVRRVSTCTPQQVYPSP